eukprot:GHRR01000856.1.p1 GENE.GHRR01000856.1~~GHRR01000856.1.p1  ORF type:complete len:497 (+),score=111.37 GHRR01000856.1:1888-3378(+)
MAISAHVGLLCCVLCLLCLSSATVQKQVALTFAEKRSDQFTKDLLELVAIPSISSLPEHIEHINKAVEWLQERLKAAGLEDVQALATTGAQPVVYADWLHAPGKPTILVYGHYDVQPVDPLDLWATPPFEPTIRGDYFYGRGVDDDKGGLLQAIHAVEAYLATSKALPVNIKFLLEGQEEIGSPNLENFLQLHKGGILAGADLALSADGGQISATQPGINTGLRGAIALEVEVSTAGIDMHSGMKGGSVQNANHALVTLLSSLKDGKGTVTVKGFYDDVEDMSGEDKQDVAAFPFDIEAEQEALGVSGFMGEQGYNILEQRWYRPTLDIVGMWGGFTGAGIKTVIPRIATAKLSCRLVAKQHPDDITQKIKKHLEASAPPLSNVTVKVLGFRSHPWVSTKDTLGNQLAGQVLEQVMGTKPVYYRDGGTIPALAYFQQTLGLNSTIFGFGLGEKIHAPNERLLIKMYHMGRTAWVELLALLGEQWPVQAQAEDKDEL